MRVLWEEGSLVHGLTDIYSGMLGAIYFLEVSFLCFWIFFLSDSYISVSIQNSLLESRDHVYLLLLLSFESSKELN